MQVTTVGLDLAKNIFQVHGISENGDVVFNQALRRAQLIAFFEKASTLPGRNGSLRFQPPLGTATEQAGP